MKTSFSISEELKKSLQIFKTQAWILVGLLVSFTIVTFTISIFQPDVQVISDIYDVTFLSLFLLSLVLNSVFSLGYIKNAFQAMDGDEPQFSAYGQESRKIIKYIEVNILSSLIIIIGFALFILPGIYLAIRLQFVNALIVDENLGVIDSLKRSWEITQGHEVKLFLVLLVFIGLILLGTICLGVGIFITIPICVIMQLYIYRKLNSPINVYL